MVSFGAICGDWRLGEFAPRTASSGAVLWRSEWMFASALSSCLAWLNRVCRDVEHSGPSFLFL